MPTMTSRILVAVLVLPLLSLADIDGKDGATVTTDYPNADGWALGPHNRVTINMSQETTTAESSTVRNRNLTKDRA